MPRILGAALGAALLGAGPRAAAQPATPYPDRPVQVVVSWQAGGVVDTIGRALAQAMSDVSEGRLGEPVLYAGRDAFTTQARRDNADKIEVVRTLGLMPQ